MDQKTVLAGLEAGLIQRITKALTAGTTLATAGRLSAEKEKTFFKKVFDTSVALKRGREIVVNSTEGIYLNAFGADTEQTILRTEEENGNGATATVTDRQLSFKKYELKYRLTDEFIEQNVEEGGVKQTVSDTMGALLALDMAKWAWMGDENTSAQVNGYAFRRRYNGWRYHLDDSAAFNAVSITSPYSVKATIFKEVVAAMPDMYKRGDIYGAPVLRCATDIADAYWDEISDRVGSVLADRVLTEGYLPPYKSYEVLRDPDLPSGTVIFASDGNLCHGRVRGLTTYKMVPNEEAGYIAAILRGYFGLQVRIPEAVVWGRIGAYTPGT